MELNIQLVKTETFSNYMDGVVLTYIFYGLVQLL